MERPREPYDPAPQPRTRWAWVAAAIAAALAASLFSPAPWPAGAGRLEVRYRDREVLARPVSIGDRAPVVATAAAGDVVVHVDFPAGVPGAAPVRGSVRAERAGAAVPLALDDVQAAVVLPDGRTEIVPVLRRDAATGALHLARRPPVRTPVALGLLGLVVVLWISGAIPLFITSLLVPVVMVAARAAPAPEALAPFFHPIIALFFGGFLMAEAMRRVGLDRMAAIAIVARAGRSPVALFFAMLAVSAFLSMWMSNTAATAVLVPIALAVTAPLGHPGYRKATVLGIAYAATIGGVGSAIGTPANPLAIEFLDEFVGRKISFLGWFAYGLPMLVFFLPLMGVYLWWRSGVRLDAETFRATRRRAEAELKQAGRLTRDQWIVLAVFLAVMALWLTQTLHGLDTGIIALAGAVALALLGKVRPVDLRRISWASLLTFGGGLALGGFLVESGTSDWLATRLAALAVLPAALGVAAVAALTLMLTTVASNTATAAMLVPLAIPLAGVLGVDPVQLVIVVAIASSIDFALVIGTPPTMIAYSTELYTTREIFKTGIALDVAGIALLATAVVTCWRLFGLVP